ncbi:MAG: citrate lyase subunit alpha, partial [Planctomycetota bacterium]
RIPVVVERVTTLCGPGELIDAVVTEHGVCINPRRADLLDAVRGSGLPLLDIRELKARIDRLCGGPPARPRLGEEFVAAIQWVDGTTIDGVRRVLP